MEMSFGVTAPYFGGVRATWGYVGRCLAVSLCGGAMMDSPFHSMGQEAHSEGDEEFPSTAQASASHGCQ